MSPAKPRNDSTDNESPAPASGGPAASAPRASLVACVTVDPLAAVADLPAEVEWIELRVDLAGDVAPDELKAAAGGDRKLLYTLRSRAEGGASEASPAGRRERLLAAAEAGFDLIDLEAARDLDPELLERLPAQRRLISWHGAAEQLPELEERFAQLATTSARYYKLVPEAARPGDDLAPLLLMAKLGRGDLVAFASGPIASWSRPLVPRLGGPLVYGALDGGGSQDGGAPAAAAGQLTIAALIADYDLPRLPPVERLFGVVGRPVAHSLSPRIHNTGYRRLGIPALYLPFHVETFGDFWIELVEGAALESLGMPLVGLSVTAPLKSVALAVAGAASPLAQSIGAANTLVLRSRDGGPSVGHEGVWEAEATDPTGVMGPLVARGIEVTDRPAAVIGAGGAGRSAALALMLAGARVTLVNRGRERGEKVAAEMKLPFAPLADFDPEPFELVVHATPAGREAGSLPPFDLERLRDGSAILDMAYGAEPTALVTAARQRGLTAIDGREVLAHQALPQFEMMTGERLPLELAMAAVGLEPLADRPIDDRPPEDER